jgi:mRNA-degrading endonuclease toxin of MazEF toxin-antitoxin module
MTARRPAGSNPALPASGLPTNLQRVRLALCPIELRRRGSAFRVRLPPRVTQAPYVFGCPIVSIHAAAAALIVALISAPASAQTQTGQDCTQPRDFTYRLSQVSAIAAHGADLGTTIAALSQDGFREANPALRWASDRPAMLGATKMTLAAGSLWLAHELHRRGHRRWAIVSNLATAALIGTVAARNAQKVRP